MARAGGTPEGRVQALASQSRLSLDSATSTTLGQQPPPPPPLPPAGPSDPTPRAHQNSISSVLADPNAAASLLPVFPSLAENPFVPASFSALSTAFSPSALPPAAPASSSSKPVAQRRSRAPPVVVSELRRVNPDEFDAYVHDITPEWDRWQKESRLGATGNPDLGKPAPPPEEGAGLGLSVAPDHAPPPPSPAHLKHKEALPPLDDVPQIFFDPGFNLSNPHTFDLVTERLRLSPASSPDLYGRPAPLPTPDSPDLDATHLPIPGLGSLTLADLAADQILQEKLSHYTAVIESHLVREIGLRSVSFFSALSNLQSLHQQGQDCLAKISELQAALVPTAPGVGRAAHDGLRILRAQARRRALERIDEGVRAVEDVWSALEGVAELVAHGEWIPALQVAEHVEELYYGATPAPSGATKVTLTRVQALSSVPRRLSALRAQIAKSLESELVAVLEHETARAVPDFVKGLWSREGKEGEEHEILERAKERARPVVGGLVRAEGMDGAVAAWREAVLRDVRAMVRVHLPSTDTPTVEDEDAFAAVSSRQSVDLGSVSEKSTLLAKKLRAMSHADFLALAERTYSGLLGTLAVVDIHARVLLSLSTELREAEIVRRVQRLGTSSAASSQLNIPSSQDRPGSPVTTSSPSGATLEADVADVVHAAAELANLRFSKVIGVRTDTHAHLTLDEFVAIFDASWAFVVQCEIICQRMIVGLRGVMVGQAKAFLQVFHQQRLTESAKLVENEQWVPADVTRNTQDVVDLVLDSAVSDPVPLLLGKRLEDRLARSSNGTAATNGKADLPATAKQLQIEGHEYFAVSAGLAAVDVLADYLKVVVNCPLLTTDAMSKVVEFMKSFNSRTCQVVLGAGAMRSAGLKNITAKHLALASQALSIMISLIPYIRETLRRHLNPKQAVMLVEFDKLKRDYQEHQNEIHSKLVAIMSDRLQVHCKTLEAVNWEQPVANRDPSTPNSYMESLVKEHVTLHKVLSRFLQASTVDYIMGQVFSALNARLADEFGKVELKSEQAKARMLVDVAYLKTKLAELKGLERATPGVELEHLVESKQLPVPARALPSPRTSMSEVPPLPKSTSTLSLVVPDSPASSSPPPLPVPSPPVVDAPPPLAPPAQPPETTLAQPPPPPIPPTPVRRKSMAERLAEIARRGKPLQETVKAELPTVPQEPEPEDKPANGQAEEPPPTPDKELPVVVPPPEAVDIVSPQGVEAPQPLADMPAGHAEDEAEPVVRKDTPEVPTPTEDGPPEDLTLDKPSSSPEAVQVVPDDAPSLLPETTAVAEGREPLEEPTTPNVSDSSTVNDSSTEAFAEPPSPSTVVGQSAASDPLQLVDPKLELENAVQLAAADEPEPEAMDEELSLAAAMLEQDDGSSPEPAEIDGELSSDEIEEEESSFV